MCLIYLIHWFLFFLYQRVCGNVEIDCIRDLPPPNFYIFFFFFIQSVIYTICSTLRLLINSRAFGMTAGERKTYLKSMQSTEIYPRPCQHGYWTSWLLAGSASVLFLSFEILMQTGMNAWHVVACSAPLPDIPAPLAKLQKIDFSSLSDSTVALSAQWAREMILSSW